MMESIGRKDLPKPSLDDSRSTDVGPLLPHLKLSSSLSRTSADTNLSTHPASTTSGTNSSLSQVYSSSSISNGVPPPQTPIFESTLSDSSDQESCEITPKVQTDIHTGITSPGFNRRVFTKKLPSGNTNSPLPAPRPPVRQRQHLVIEKLSSNSDGDNQVEKAVDEPDRLQQPDSYISGSNSSNSDSSEELLRQSHLSDGEGASPCFSGATKFGKVGTSQLSDESEEDKEAMQRNMSRFISSPSNSNLTTPESRTLSPASSQPSMEGWDKFRTSDGDTASSAGSISSTTSALFSQDIRSARHRNFIVGHLSAKSGLLGTDTLERLFPDRKIQVFVGTWNIGSQKQAPTDLEDFVLPVSIGYVPDVYAIGIQENSAERKHWEVSLQEVIGPNHVLFDSAQLGAIHLAIFMKRDLIWYCSVCEESKVLTRMYTPIATKGAAALSFTLFGTSFLFICSHFKAHDGNLQERIEDFLTIRKGVDLPRLVRQNGYLAREDDATARFDCTFWFGDMNFRIIKNKEFVERVIQEEKEKDHPHYERLVRNDELTLAMNEGRVFEEFSEGRITFPPTYKFDILSKQSQDASSTDACSDPHSLDVYDSSQKARIPSYTDRILFRSRMKNYITCVHYESAREIRSSDHRPVYGLYEVHLKPGSDSIPMSGGEFKRDVYLEAIRRRALHRVINKVKDKRKKQSVSGTKSSRKSAVCLVM